MSAVGLSHPWLPKWPLSVNTAPITEYPHIEEMDSKTHPEPHAKLIQCIADLSRNRSIKFPIENIFKSICAKIRHQKLQFIEEETAFLDTIKSLSWAGQGGAHL